MQSLIDLLLREDLLKNVALSVLSSLVAAFFFWRWTFVYSATKARFSPKLERSPNTGEFSGAFRYRIRVINTGKRDLIDIAFIVKLSIKRETATNYTYIGLGNENILPVLRGKKHQYKHKGLRCAHTLTAYITDTALTEFKKKIYAKDIRDKAVERELSLSDIFDKFGEKAQISVFLFGNDSLTGARKMFQQTYKYEDIQEGGFCPFALPHRLRGYQKAVEIGLDIESKIVKGQEEQPNAAQDDTL